MPKIKAPHQRERSVVKDQQPKQNVLQDAASAAPPVFSLDANSPAEKEEQDELQDDFAPTALLEAAAADADAPDDTPEGGAGPNGGSGGGEDGSDDGNGAAAGSTRRNSNNPDGEEDDDPEARAQKTYTMPALEASNLIRHGAFRHPSGMPTREGIRLIKNPTEGISLNRRANQKVHIIPKAKSRPMDKIQFKPGAAIQMKPMEGGDAAPKATPFVAQMHGPGGGPGGGPPNPPGGGTGPGPAPQGPSPTPAEQEGSGLPPTEGGSKLPSTISEKFEAAFGSDFSSVRLHIDSDYAEQIGAQAFTYGEHIYFAPGKFNPSSKNGIRLIAHEIVHVLQQREGAVQPNMRMGRLAINYDRRLEREADDFGRLAADFDMSWLDHWNDTIDEMVDIMIDYQENEGTWEGWENEAGAGAYEEYLDGHGEEAQVSPDYHTPEPEIDSSKSTPAPEPPIDTAPAPDPDAGSEQPDVTIIHNPALDTVGDYLRTHADPVIAADKAEIQTLGTNQREKEDTTTKVIASKKSSGQPNVEPGSRVERDKSGEVDEVAEPTTRPEEAKGAFDTKLQTILPNTLKEVYKFKKKGKAKVLPAAAMQVVQADVDTIDGTYREIENLPYAVAPDPGVGLTGIEKAKSTPDIKPGQGAIAPLQSEQTNFQTYSDQVDEAIKREHLDDEKLELVNTGRIKQIKDSRDETRQGVQDAPVEIETVRNDEQKGMNRKMKEKEKKRRKEMKNQRDTGLKSAQGEQEKAKSQIDSTRDQVANHIDQLYQTAKETVTEKLANLKTSALEEFKVAQESATQEFENNVDTRIRAFKKKRYKGWRGKLRWLKDLFKGIAHLKEVKEILDSEKEAFIEKIDTAISGIMERSKATIDECKLIVSTTRIEIDEYVETLQGDLRFFAEGLRDKVFADLDELDQEITYAEDELRNELEAAKQEAIEKIEDIIAKLKKKMAGLLEKIIRLVFKVAIIFLKLALQALGLDPAPFIELLKGVEEAVIAILQRPAEFFSDLFSSLKEGFKMFTSDLKRNLLRPIIEWLLGKLSGTGLYIPKAFTGKELLKLALSVFGLSWDYIKQKIVDKMGTWGTVAMNLMDIWDAFKKDGIKGVWDAYSGKVTNWSYDKLRKKLVKKMGEDGVRKMENTIRLVVRVMEDGPEALLEEIETGLDILKQIIIDKIKDWIIEKLIEKGLEKIMANFVPGVNFVAWLWTIYTLIIWFFNNIDLFGKLFTAIGKALRNIADGDVMAAAEKIVVAMRVTIVLALDFLFLYMGWNRIVDKIQEALDKVRGWVGKAIDKVLDWIVKGFKWIFKKLKDLFRGGDDDGTVDDDSDSDGGDDGAQYDEETQERIDTGLDFLMAEQSKKLENGKISEINANDVATRTKNAHNVFTSMQVVDGRYAPRDEVPDPETWVYKWTASPATHTPGAKKIEDPIRYARNGISAAVGATSRAKNFAVDVRIVQKLLKDALMMSAGDFASEHPASTVPGTDVIPQTSLSKTIAAIKKFQKDILGQSSPDGRVDPNGQTYRKLVAEAERPSLSPDDLSDIDDARDEFDWDEEDGTRTLAHIDFPVGNVTSGNYYSDVARVQKRLLDLGYLSTGDYEFERFSKIRQRNQAYYADKPGKPRVVNIKKAHLPKTIAALHAGQRDREVFYIQKYLKKALTALGWNPAIPYKSKVMKPDGPTFVVLKEFGVATVTYTDSSGKVVTIELQNFSPSKYTDFLKDGWYRNGDLDPAAENAKLFTDLGIPSDHVEPLRYVASNEGNFDAINTWDGAKLSFGFVQFAGTYTLSKMMATLKHIHYESFQRFFERYGIFVTYTYDDKNNKVRTAEFSVVDPATGIFYTEDDAYAYIQQNPQLIGVFLQAAQEVYTKKAQILTAYNLITAPGLSKSFSIDLPIVHALKADKTTVEKSYVGAKATAFKTTAEYTTLKAAGQIDESKKLAGSFSLGSYANSEKGLACIFDWQVHKPAGTAKAFKYGTIKMAEKYALTTKAAVEAKGEKQLLEGIVEYCNTTSSVGYMEGRVQKLIDTGKLSF